MADNLVTIEFKQSMAPYGAGEMAGFPEEKAKHLCSVKLDGKPLARIPTESEIRAYLAKKHPAVPAKPRETLTVRFLVSAPPYRTGESAGLPPDVAQDYVDRGLVELVLDEKSPAPQQRSVDAPAVDKAMLSPAAKKALGR